MFSAQFVGPQRALLSMQHRQSQWSTTVRLAIAETNVAMTFGQFMLLTSWECAMGGSVMGEQLIRVAEITLRSLQRRGSDRG
jgi:hypothetical protein